MGLKFHFYYGWGWEPRVLCSHSLLVTLEHKRGQKPLQYCKVISLQLIKINEKKKKELDHKKKIFLKKSGSLKIGKRISGSNNWNLNQPRSLKQRSFSAGRCVTVNVFIRDNHLWSECTWITKRKKTLSGFTLLFILIK